MSPSAALVAGGHSFAKTAPFWIGMLVLNALAIGCVVGALLYCRYRRGQKGKRLTSFRHFVHHQHAASEEKPTHSVSPAQSAGEDATSSSERVGSRPAGCPLTLTRGQAASGYQCKISTVQVLSLASWASANISARPLVPTLLT